MSDTSIPIGAGGRVIQEDQIGQMVGWLEAQRLQDKEQLHHLSQGLERLVTQIQEMAVQIRALEEGLRNEQANSARLSFVRTEVRQAKDEMIVLQQKMDGAAEQHEKAVSLLQTETTRTQAVLSELSKTVSDLEQQVASANDRVSLLSHELRGERASSGELVRTLESLSGRQESLAGRQQLLEEQLRKISGQLIEIERQQEAIKADRERDVEWNKATELRYSRQSADWEARAEVWQKATEEQSRLIQQFGKQLQQGLSEIPNIQRRFVDAFQKGEESARDLRKLESLRQTDREELNHMQQALDRIQGKIEEQGKVLRQLEEIGRLTDSKIANLHVLLDRQRERLDGMTGSWTQLDQRQRSEVSDLAGTQLKVKAQYEEVQQSLVELRRLVDEQSERSEAALVQLRQLEEQHRMRQITELQRQLQELKDFERGV